MAAEEDRRGRDHADGSSPPPPRAERAPTGGPRRERPPVEPPRRERPPVDATWRQRPAAEVGRRPAGRRVATSAVEVPPSPDRPAVRGRRMAFPLPADLPTRAERAAWPPPATGAIQPGPTADGGPGRPGRRARVTSPVPDPTADQLPTTPAPPASSASSALVAADPSGKPDVDLDEQEGVLPRLPRADAHRARPLPVALSDEHAFEADLGPPPASGRRVPADLSPDAREAGTDSATAGRRRRTDDSPGATTEPAWRPVLPESAGSGPRDLAPAERPRADPAPAAPARHAEPVWQTESHWRSVLAQRPEPAQQAEPVWQTESHWRSVLAQRPEPARSELPSTDRPPTDAAGHDTPERGTPERGTTEGDTPGRDQPQDLSPGTRRPVDHAGIPQDLRPRGLRRAEDTEESGSQTVTDTRRQAARPPARPQPDPRGSANPAQGRAGRRNTDPREMGMPAFVAVLVGVGGSVLGAFLDILVTGGVGLLFSLCFVLTAFGVAAGVRRTGMFPAGVLPPFAALASLVVVAAVDPKRIATTTSPVRAVLVGLAWESWTIVAGCAVALVTIAVRLVYARRARVSASRRPAEAYATPGAARRSGSPRRS
ncbi:DUF6542 domain-containing protein [Actinopolymorpha sp. NPDC004070]|uniref:DUF6542 domain-containing protein n=1 Tax=Actinopolymorpha sp. NPDC004070 TaxID=3154548 RepID=UPI0033A30FC4